MSEIRISDESLELVAAAVGRSCYWWTGIEFVLQELCVNLARFHDRQFDLEAAEHVLTVALSHMDARQRVAVAKALAASAIDPDLYGQIETLLNLVDNVLRVERNRYVHDQWSVLDNTIIRRKHGAKVVRPQSRELSVRFSHDMVYTSVKDVEIFADRLSQALDDLTAIHDELEELYREIWTAEI